MGFGFWPWNFQGMSHNFAEFPGEGEALFFSRISTSKVTNLKIPGFFLKRYILKPPVWIYAGIAKFIETNMNATFSLLFKHQSIFPLAETFASSRDFVCWVLLKGYSTPNRAKFLRLGHDPSQNLIRNYQVVNKKYDNPQNFSLIYFTD